jgi:phosphotransferase system enzyme I (PtsI)
MRDLTLRGKPISPGYASAPAVLWGQGDLDSADREIQANELAGEVQRFRCSLERSRQELQRLSERVQAELGSAEAEIFSAHLLFLQDPQFVEAVEEAIRSQHRCVESAVRGTVQSLALALSAADSPYLRERVEDLRDLERRVLRNVTQPCGNGQSQLQSPAVVVARELLPSDLLEMDRRFLAGIVTEVGGEAGHAAILARALGIPAVTGVPDATSNIRPGQRVLLDGHSAEVVFDPSPEREAAFAVRRVRYDQATRRAASTDRLECVTADGLRIGLMANIGRAHEVEFVEQHRLDGVGLFRTEYLFLDERETPSLDRQLQIYRQVATTLQGRPLVIRTLDLGGDKFPAFLAPRFEANPNLGVRGLRFSLLAAQDLFRTQMTAILRLSREFDIRVLLPMVLGGSDLREAVTLIRQFADDEGIASLPPIGALVETPSAVFSIGDVLRYVDFVSIGTNDLTQFILAADRNALATIDDYTALHPSVLRAIRQVVRTATAAGKPVSICGEAAADARFACLLVGLGARTLSMNPISASRVRFAIRAMSGATLTSLGEQALACDSALGVGALLDDCLRQPLADIL